MIKKSNKWQIGNSETSETSEFFFDFQYWVKIEKFTYVILFHQKHGYKSIPNAIPVLLFTARDELVGNFIGVKNVESINLGHPAKTISWNLAHPKPKTSTLRTNLSGPLERHYIHAILIQMKSQMLAGLEHVFKCLHD